MEEVREKKNDIRNEVKNVLNSRSRSERSKKTKDIENRLFEFANFLEAKIALLHLSKDKKVRMEEIIERCFSINKTVVLPAFDIEKHDMTLMKVGNLKADLKTGSRGLKEPKRHLCKIVPIEYIDIAFIPGIAFDEKGGRIGSGEGYYDRLIPKLPNTTRKVSLAFEDQIVQQVPMETHDRYIDILITETRIIYKI
ncbi:MAG: 5-formyltetrahydrofolate cyclo-ligase [Desulfobacterales bacterium]